MAVAASADAGAAQQLQVGAYVGIPMLQQEQGLFGNDVATPPAARRWGCDAPVTAGTR